MRDLECDETYLNINFSKEYHIIHHKAEKWSKFWFRWNVLLQGLSFNNIGYLLLSAIFKDEVDPWELLLHFLIMFNEKVFWRVRIEDLHTQPTWGWNLNHNQIFAFWLLNRTRFWLLLLKQILLEWRKKLLELERPILGEDKSVQEIEGLQGLLFFIVSSLVSQIDCIRVEFTR